MTGPVVTRCVCLNVEFRRVIPYLREEKITSVVELQSEIDIGSGCGLCLPYLQRTIETGVTEHALLGEKERRDLIARSGCDSSDGEGGGEDA